MIAGTEYLETLETIAGVFFEKVSRGAKGSRGGS
jgi:hypothetical protein